MIKPHDIIRLVKKHIILLILIPALLGTAVAFLTTNVYQSKTTLYTGMTSGTNVQIDQSFNLFTSNAAFDNLINIIQSRETSQEVSIRLLAQHLMMKRADPRYISEKSLMKLNLSLPAEVRRLAVRTIPKSDGPSAAAFRADSAWADTVFSFNQFNDINSLNLQPPYLNSKAYEQTVINLKNYLAKNDTNFIYRLISGSDPHYSISAISAVDVHRIGASDLIELRYTSDDPGICQQTLALLTESCMKNYRATKETRTDAVVKYFEFKTRQTYERLAQAEAHLQQFNQEHNIINYADQSRSAAGMSASLAGELQNKRIKLIGLESTVGQLQEKMNSQQKSQLTSTNLIEKRNQLADINARIATAKSMGTGGTTGNQDLESLKDQAKKLNEEIGDAISELYNNSSSVQGMTGGTLLETYLTNVKELQETKASIAMLQNRMRESQQEYKSYEPAGVDLKRIEREITIAEQEYMETLRGLNLAKLKVQDVALSSNIKAVDSPYFPKQPNKSKRLMLIAAAILFGLILVISAILIMEYFDETLRNPQKASKILNLNPAGVFPRISGKNRGGLMRLVTSRLVEMIIQQVELHPSGKPIHSGPRTILLFSTLSNEGKTVLMDNVTYKLKQQGKKVLAFNFSGDSLLESEIRRLDQKAVRSKHKQQDQLDANPDDMAIALVEEDLSSDPDQDGLSLGIRDAGETSEEHLIYRVDQSYYSVNSYLDLLNGNPFKESLAPDYVLIELPPLLYHSYPAELVASSDVAIMVCRANRSWSEADQGVLNTFMKLSPHDPLFILNGVERQVVKSFIGELPKKEKKIRRKMRKTEKV
ncbi:MAG: Wzz/FepE/Etk N-terminal domain-containing protein [Bacteroidetes bacterium]|nr:Wzz/FepE/Etk N-terminal domain-containing protein [Bacteroidota bacterium]